MKGHAVVCAIQPGAGAHAPAAMPGPMLAGAGLAAAATVAGAWLVRGHPGRRWHWLCTRSPKAWPPGRELP
jgi:hypothetical protein